MAVPLTIGAKTADTVFDLLGSAENDLTYALGWALAKADGFAAALLSDVFGGDDVGRVVSVSLQKFGPDRGYTDVEVSAEHAHLIIEAKKGWAVPNEVQLGRYALRPGGTIRSVLLSVSACSRDFAQAPNRLPAVVGDVPVQHRAWHELAQLAAASSRRGPHASRQLLRDTARYLEGAARMQNVSSNWAYCVALKRGPMAGYHVDMLDIPIVHLRYAHPYGSGNWPKVPPNYMAFRWGGTVRQFHHVEGASVVDDLADAMPELIDPGISIGPHAVYELGPAVVLPTPLPKGKVDSRAHVWVMLDTLFTSSTLKEASVISQARRQAVGESPEPD